MQRVPANLCLLSQSVKWGLEAKGSFQGLRYPSLPMRNVPDLQSVLPDPDHDMGAQRGFHLLECPVLGQNQAKVAQMKIVPTMATKGRNLHHQRDEP